MKQYNLITRSAYTFFESLLSIDDIINFAKNNKMSEVCLIDKNVMYGAMEFYNLATSNNLKPIIGLEIDYSNINKILIAKNEKGYKELVKISSLIMSNAPIPTSLKSKNLIELSAELMFHSVIASKDLQTLLSFSSINNKELKKNLINLLTEEEAKKIYKKDLLKQIEEIIAEVNILLTKKTNVIPKFKIKGDTSTKVFFQNLLKKELKLYFEKNKIIDQKIYLDRMIHEYEVITSMNFEDYFLIVWDFIKWAKENGIFIGPGRGSAPGSLISFLLNITTIDPIKAGLYFERFLNKSRKSMPDIDIDIEDVRRDEVLHYIVNKYGQMHVAQIITFQTLRARMSIRDVGRVLNTSLSDVDVLSKSTPEFDTLKKSYTSSQKYKTLIDSKEEYKKIYDIASLIEGLPRQYSTHAAGVVLSDDEIWNLIPIQKGYGDFIQTQYSMDYMEENGLLKIDLLGLRNLSFIKEIILLIKQNHNEVVELDNLEFNDPKVFKILSSGNTSGIFQLESPGMTNLLKEMKIDSFNDIVAATSLFRPGPQKNIPSYIARKLGKEKISYINEKIEMILKDTYGIIVYQEQVMEMAKEFANFDLQEADNLRRAISKKDHLLLDKLKEKFYDGARSNGYEDKVIKNVFELIDSFGDYGFNKSHAYAYSVISYQLAYLKAYFPLCFTTALLSSVMGSFDKTSFYMDEAKKLNIEIKEPNINISEEHYLINDNKIYYGISALKGIGLAAAKLIVDERKQNGLYKDFLDFLIRIRDKKVNKNVIANLIKANAFSDFSNRTTLINSLQTYDEFLNMIEIKKDNIISYDRSLLPEPKIKVVKDEGVDEYEKDSFGFIQGKPTTSITTTFIQDQNVVANGKILSIRKIMTKAGTDMAFASMLYNDQKLNLTIWPALYKKYIDKLKIGSVLKIEGKIDLSRGETLIVSKIE